MQEILTYMSGRDRPGGARRATSDRAALRTRRVASPCRASLAPRRPPRAWARAARPPRASRQGCAATPPRAHPVRVPARPARSTGSFLTTPQLALCGALLKITRFKIKLNLY